jgi:ParB-like chromosome segregation protein Spo0J
LQITGAIMGDEGMEQPDFLKRPAPEKVDKSDDVVDQTATDPAPSNNVESGTGTTSIQPSEPDDLVAHPFADLFPMMPESDLKRLVTSITQDGQDEKIVMHEGKILDGRNRYAACKEAGVDPEFDDYDGTDPMSYVIRKNLYRRNLNTSQKGMTAARLASLTRGGDRRSEGFKASIGGLKIENAAELVGVGEKTVDRAKTVLSSDRSDLIRAVDDGTMTVAAAVKALKKPKEPEEPEVPEKPEVLTGEQESQRLLKLWGNTGEEGRALFLKHINRDDVPQIPEA